MRIIDRVNKAREEKITIVDNISFVIWVEDQNLHIAQKGSRKGEEHLWSYLKFGPKLMAKILSQFK